MDYWEATFFLRFLRADRVTNFLIIVSLCLFAFTTMLSVQHPSSSTDTQSGGGKTSSSSSRSDGTGAAGGQTAAHVVVQATVSVRALAQDVQPPHSVVPSDKATAEDVQTVRPAIEQEQRRSLPQGAEEGGGSPSVAEKKEDAAETPPEKQQVRADEDAVGAPLLAAASLSSSSPIIPWHKIKRKLNPDLCEDRKVLWSGHSHVKRIKQAQCRLLSPAVKMSRDCPPYGWMATEAYLDLGNLVMEQKSILKSARKQKFDTVIMGIWTWDLTFMNSHPSVLRDRIRKALPFFAGLLREYPPPPSRSSSATTKVVGTRESRSSKSSSPTSRSASTNNRGPPKILVMLPHWYSQIQYVARRVCETPERVKMYSDAIEAAAFEFKEKLEKEAADSWGVDNSTGGISSRKNKPAVEVLMLDIYNWTKGLHGGNLMRGKEIDDPYDLRTEPHYTPGMPFSEGDADFIGDGHLRPSRQEDIARGLFERGVLCDPGTPKLTGPRELVQDPTFIRVPRDTRQRNFLEKSTEEEQSRKKKTQKQKKEAEEEQEDAKNTETSEVSTMPARRNKDDVFVWPSMPSCESTAPKSEANLFWGNMPVWPWTLGKMAFHQHNVDSRAQLLKMIRTRKLPRSPVLRYQVEQQLLRRPVKDLDDWAHDAIRIKECFRNVGLDDNRTSWEVVGEPGNVDYILWQRNGGRSSRKPPWIPAVAVPDCVCVNQTHLIDEVHVALLADAEAKKKNGNNAAKSISILIAEKCGKALRRFQESAR